MPLTQLTRTDVVAFPGQFNLEYIAGNQHVSCPAVYQLWSFSSFPSTSLFSVHFQMGASKCLKWVEKEYRRCLSEWIKESCQWGKKTIKMFQSSATRNKIQAWLFPKLSQQKYSPISCNSTLGLVSLKKTEGVENNTILSHFLVFAYTHVIYCSYKQMTKI